MRFGDVPAHALALGADGVIYVVAPAEASGPVLFAVDAGTGRPRFTLALPGGVEVRVPVPDPMRGRLYLLASRAAGRIGGRQAVVVVVDPAGHRVTDMVPLGRADEHHWIPYAGELFADSGRLGVSFHGEDTTGLDILDAASLRPSSCARPDAAHCTTEVHGSIQAYGDGLVAATGGEELLLLTVDGRVTRRLTTGLAGNHLMEFDVDDERDVVYAIGPCGYTGGLARVAIGTGTSRLIRPSPGADESDVEERVCGDSIAVVDSGHAVAITRRNKIQIVDTDDGRIRHTVELEGVAIDAATDGRLG